jgi:hypothetical protein
MQVFGFQYVFSEGKRLLSFFHPNTWGGTLVLLLLYSYFTALVYQTKDIY